MRSSCCAALAAFLALGGCASPVQVKHDTYPIDWPALAPATSACPDLTGRYSNADSATGKVLLARWALPSTATPLEAIPVVELDGPHDKVVTLRVLEGPIGNGATAMTERGRRQWKEGENYLCENGWLVLSDTKLLPLVVVVANTKARFTRAVDGSLIVERREEGGGVVIVVPMYVSTTNWFRYARVP